MNFTSERERNRIISSNWLLFSLHARFSTRITYILCDLIYLFPPNWIRILFSSLSLEDKTRVTIFSGAQQMNIRSGWQLNNHWRNESTSTREKFVPLLSCAFAVFSSVFWCLIHEVWSVNFHVQISWATAPTHHTGNFGMMRAERRYDEQQTRERKIPQREWENLVCLANVLLSALPFDVFSCIYVWSSRRNKNFLYCWTFRSQVGASRFRFPLPSSLYVV